MYGGEGTGCGEERKKGYREEKVYFGAIVFMVVNI